LLYFRLWIRFGIRSVRPPPALVGRSVLLESFTVTLGRALAGRAVRGLFATGLRGVGKTVLLNRFDRIAQDAGFKVAFMEASDDGSFLTLLAGRVRNVILELDRLGALSEAAKRAMRVFKSFTLRFGPDGLALSIDVDPERGRGDSGDLPSDLADLFVALGEAARDRHTGVLFAIDECQYLSERELAALIMAIHRTTQLQLPVLIVGAGLPSLPALAGEAKSYAERLFDFPQVDRLAPADATAAIVEPARSEGIAFEADAVARIVSLTHGYPYFIQEWAYHVWNQAPASPITRADVDRTEPHVIAHLDQSFFRVRFDRLTPKERRYLLAMAELGPGPHRSGDIAAAYGAKVESLAPMRSALIRKGMIYSPAHGDTAYTVPLFDEFMLRVTRTASLAPPSPVVLPEVDRDENGSL
jgi:hypothetical protein